KGDGQLNNTALDGNVAFNNGAVSAQYASSGNANLLMGGQEAARQGTIVNNMTYFSPGIGVYNVVLGLGTYQNSDVTFANNYLVGGSWVLSIGAWSRIAASGNVMQG